MFTCRSAWLDTTVSERAEEGARQINGKIELRRQLDPLLVPSSCREAALALSCCHYQVQEEVA
jgi:hypothetical protein